tara:strand:- start:73 stop:333 length:261 start_codon:yes stop_codon:yes gene_type:complete
VLSTKRQNDELELTNNVPVTVTVVILVRDPDVGCIEITVGRRLYVKEIISSSLASERSMPLAVTHTGTTPRELVLGVVHVSVVELM